MQTELKRVITDLGGEGRESVGKMIAGPHASASFYFACLFALWRKWLPVSDAPAALHFVFLWFFALHRCTSTKDTKKSVRLEDENAAAVGRRDSGQAMIITLCL